MDQTRSSHTKESQKRESAWMLVFADVAMIRRGIALGFFLALACAHPTYGQTVLTTVTPEEYDALIQRFLPCSPLPRDAEKSQLCLRIVPPGHRPAEREVLVEVFSNGDHFRMKITRPERPLARSAKEAKEKYGSTWPAEVRVDLRSREIRNKKLVEQVIGRGWRKVVAEIAPPETWYADPTTYYLRTHAFGGDGVLEWRGPGATVSVQPSAFLTWAEAVRRRAEALLAHAK